MKEQKNLVEALTDEILRVTEIKNEYLQLPGGAGRLAAMLMENSIDMARKAQVSNDIVLMIAALEALKEYEL